MPDNESTPGTGHIPFVTYSPGDDWLTASRSVLVLLSGDTDPDLVHETWALASRGAGLVDLTAALVRHGLARLGGFCVAVVGHDSVQVVLRGSVVVVQGDSRFDDEGRATWSELVLPTQSLLMEFGPSHPSMELPLVDGVVRASAVRWSLDRSSAFERGIDSAAPTFSQTDDLVSGRHAIRALDPELSPAAAESPSAGAPPAGPPVIAVDSGAADVSSREGDQPAETLRDEELKAVLANQQPVDSSGLHRAQQLAPTDRVGDGANSDEDSYDRLFGATAFVAKSAPVLPTEQESVPSPPIDSPQDEVVALAVSTTSAQTSIVEVLPVPTRPDEPDFRAPSTSAAPLISSIPDWSRQPDGPPMSPPASVAPPSGVAAVTPPIFTSDDPSGLTISRTELLARRSPGPTIHGVRCPAGHPNPPEATACRECGLEIEPQTSTTMPRPILGVLVLEGTSSGAPASIPVEGTFILGRRPSVDRVTDTVPRLVELPSPEQDLSRNHVRVNVEGWHVLVTDLGSKNGTVVIPPNEPPQRLHADRPVMITPGTRLVLAEVMTYRFEVAQ